MKAVALLLIISSTAFAQSAQPPCTPTKLKVKISKDRSQHPTPPPESGKAMVYLLGRGTIELDGKWVGALNGGYSFLQVDPGEHHFCAESPYGLGAHRVVSAHSLDAKAGQTYCFYAFWVNVKRPEYKFTLQQVDLDEGARMVATAKYSTSAVK